MRAIAGGDGVQLQVPLTGAQRREQVGAGVHAAILLACCGTAASNAARSGCKWSRLNRRDVVQGDDAPEMAEGGAGGAIFVDRCQHLGQRLGAEAVAIWHTRTIFVLCLFANGRRNWRCSQAVIAVCLHRTRWMTRAGCRKFSAGLALLGRDGTTLAGGAFV